MARSRAGAPEPECDRLQPKRSGTELLREQQIIPFERESEDGRDCSQVDKGYDDDVWVVSIADVVSVFARDGYRDVTEFLQSREHGPGRDFHVENGHVATRARLFYVAFRQLEALVFKFHPSVLINALLRLICRL